MTFAVTAQDDFIYFPFAGTNLANLHTGFEAWPPFDGEGYVTGMVTLSWPVWQFQRSVNTNFHKVATKLTTLSAQTIAVSPRILSLSNNVFMVATNSTNSFGTMSNYLSLTWQLVYGSPAWQYSTDGSNWNSGLPPITNVGVLINGVGLGTNSFEITNAYGYSMSLPGLFGVVRETYGERIRVSPPAGADDVVPWGVLTNILSRNGLTNVLP